jgi:DNA-binding LytR/AlgR family response regulator
MDEKGITDKTFVKISKSHRVNAEHILQYNPNHTIDVYVFEEGKKQLKVSENYHKDVKRILK